MGTFGKRFLLISALIALPVSTQALITYNTLGEPGDTYNTLAGWLVNGNLNPPQPFVGEAFAFVPTTSGNLNLLNLAISADSGNLANISIAANSGGNLPGTHLESFLNVSAPGPFGVSNPVTSLTSTVHPFLQAGQTYWLTVEPASPTAAIIVNQNSQGLLAPQAQEFSPSGWIAKGNKTTFGFSVDVLEVPEPSTVALTALVTPVVIPSFWRRFPGAKRL